MATPAGAVAGLGAGAVVGGGYGAWEGVKEAVPLGAEAGTNAGRWLDQKLANMMKGDEEAEKKTDLPPNTVCSGCGGYLGTQDSKSKDKEKRRLSGPLDPANGGTGDAEKDFDVITGGNHQDAGNRFPSGSRIGPNNELFRPGTGSTGPRIDLPASGGKLPETLHY